MRKPNELVAQMHTAIRPIMKAGTSPMEINDFVEAFAERNGASCAQIGYKGYPFATCISVNDVIAHGFPTHTPLKTGDVVTLDTVFDVDGWKGDSAWTYMIGNVSERTRKLVEVTKECLDLSIQQAVVGNYTGDLGHAIQTHAEKQGFSVVRELLAHGIGRSIHEDPVFQHVGHPGKGILLEDGMVLTIEPMINEGTHHMYVENDGWTARTKDGKRSAQFEHTIAITTEGPEILTAQGN